jgi:hypothetical protein
VLSISMDLEVMEGVVEPVRAGEYRSASLIGEGMVVGEVTKDFSLPVRASEIARKPRTRRALLDMGILPFTGSVMEKLDLSLVVGDCSKKFGVGSASRLVTVGEMPPPEMLRWGVLALADLKRPLNMLLWYAFEAGEVTDGTRSLIESVLPSLECLFKAAADARCESSAILERREWPGLAALSRLRRTLRFLRLSNSPPEK